jgi:alkyl hydroperoxide reductase subunit AhpC
VIAISVDSPEDSEKLRRSQGYTFPILSDAQEDVIRRWDLVHLHGRRDGADISRPAEFLIDPSGKVRWVNLTEDFVVRARPEEALAAFDAMNKSSRSGTIVGLGFYSQIPEPDVGAWFNSRLSDYRKVPLPLNFGG